jgi:microcystin-dependent protein
METPLIGMIKLFPYDFIPMGWLKCDGTTLNISYYSALYSLLGVQFGGNGSSTFQLPNLTDANPIANTVFAIAAEGIYPVRS